MKVVVNALVAIALLGSIVLADDLDDQIKRLEKENKLLELQKKKQELQNDIQMVNQNNTQGNNSSTSRAKNGKNGKVASKNGIFIGVEGAIFDQILSVSPVFGLFGGYQHYFGQSQQHGIKATLHAQTNFDDVPYDFNVDVKYLWDFLQRGKHTLGLNAGIGFAIFSREDDEVSTSVSCDGSLGGGCHTSYYHYTENSTGFLATGVVGLHYYYGHHQFELLSGYPNVLALNYAYRF